LNAVWREPTQRGLSIAQHFLVRSWRGGGIAALPRSPLSGFDLLTGSWMASTTGMLVLAFYPDPEGDRVVVDGRELLNGQGMEIVSACSVAGCATAPRP